LHGGCGGVGDFGAPDEEERDGTALRPVSPQTQNAQWNPLVSASWSGSHQLKHRPSRRFAGESGPPPVLHLSGGVIQVTM
jgi:hypothetical protein